MNSILYLLLLFGDVNYNEYVVVQEKVDAIEINHVYDGDGKHVLDQVIFWNTTRNEEKDNKTLLRWIMIKKGRSEYTEKQKQEIKRHWREQKFKFPEGFKLSKWDGLLYLRRYHSLNRYRYMFHDGTTFRDITSKGFFDTHTQYDREVEFRKVEPKEDRIGLLNANPSP